MNKNKKYIISVLISLIIGIIPKLLDAKPMSWTFTILFSLVIFVFIAAMPWNHLWKRFMQVLKSSYISLFSKVHPLKRLFDFDNEQVQIVYTCRSRLDKAPCPRYDANDNQLKHSICLHTPIDEFFTLQSIANLYKDQIISASYEQLLSQFECSIVIDKYDKLFSPKENKLNRSNLPNMIFNNLIIIGENSVSNLFLDKLRIYSNFYPSFIFQEDIKDQGNKRPIINLVFSTYNGNKIEQIENLYLKTNFANNESNAVALICYAPNPFNAQKRILILFGCHRVGQYLLESWLENPRTITLLKSLLRKEHLLNNKFGQIALHASYIMSHDDKYIFKRINTTSNKSLKGISFFPYSVQSRKISINDFEIDKGVSQDPMVDISLIIELSKNDTNIIKNIEKYFQKEFHFMTGHYWESQVEEIGLHVTLHEFSNYDSHETLSEASLIFKKLEVELPGKIIELAQKYNELSRKNKDRPSTRMSLVGCEVYPSSVIIYADLSTNFLEDIGEICRTISKNNRYFNRLRIPFPLHCTVIRFNRDLNEDEKTKLKSFSNMIESRKYNFGDFTVHNLSLLLTSKKPYQDVRLYKKIVLAVN
jgi:hypothetical protein